jgi:hypothetical protein
MMESGDSGCDAGTGPSQYETTMLTPSDIDALDALARELARQTFGGEGSVVRTGNGPPRLTLVRRENGGQLYRQRDVSAPTYRAAIQELCLAIDSIPQS